MTDTVETGWLIEIAWSRYPTMYWDGCGWGADSLKAVRFVRKEDGERVLNGVCFSMKDKCKVIQHMWTNNYGGRLYS